MSVYDKPTTTADASNADLLEPDLETTSLTQQRIEQLPPSSGFSIEQFVTPSVLGRGRDAREKVAEARRIGQMLGKRGFYRFPAGQGLIEGETIDLAYALVQAWGMSATQCTITSVQGARVMLRGLFVDLATLVVTARDYEAILAPPPGKFRDDPVQSERWAVMQEQAAISKAIRGAILGGLPAWYVEAGFQAAMAAVDAEVLDGGLDDKKRPIVLTLPQARARTIRAWTEKGLTQAEMEAIAGEPAELWSVVELQKFEEMWGRLARTPIERLKVIAAERAGKAAASAGDDVAKSATGVKRTRKPKTDEPAKTEPSAHNARAAEVQTAEGLLAPEQIAAIRANLKIPAGYSTFDMSEEQLTAYNAAISGEVDRGNGGGR